LKLLPRVENLSENPRWPRIVPGPIQFSDRFLVKPYGNSLGHPPESLQHLAVDLRNVLEFLQQGAKGVCSATCHCVFQEPLERALDSHPLRSVHVGTDHHFVAGLAAASPADFHGPDLHAGGRRRDQVPSEGRQPGDTREA